MVPHIDTLHGEERRDPYAWLRDHTDPAVTAYVEAENRYTDAVMQPTLPLQETFYREMVGRLQADDASVPVRIGAYDYYTRQAPGQQFPVHYRQYHHTQTPEQMVLDENLLASGQHYFFLGVFKPSPNHQLLAYTIDTTGAETYTLWIKNVATGQMFPEVLSNVYSDVEWANDNMTLFYTILDAAKRPYKLYRHQVGSPQTADVLLYHERDAAFRVRLSKTASQIYLFMRLDSLTSSEVFYLPVAAPTAPWQVIQPRQTEMRYGVEHQGERFFILTNEQATNFKVMQTLVQQPGRPHWQEMVPHQDSVKIDTMQVFANYLVLYERRQGLKHIRVLNLTDQSTHDIAFPEPAYVLWPEKNQDFAGTVLRFAYASLVTPRTVFDYDMVTRTRTVRKQDVVGGTYDPRHYHTERLWAPAADGTLIPISLVYAQGMVQDGQHPLLLEGYGAYGASLEPVFSAERLSLLDRGFIYAIAHVRGGGEMGRGWYEAGKLQHKDNTFTDFIACANYVLAQHYTRRDRLIITGESAGGLLMGAVVNRRPELFQAVIARVPFVDVINTMRDPSLPLVVIEYEEWGNPQQRDDYAYMKTYAPYDNVTAQAYPHMLVTAGWNDPRVPYWEAAKWVARLRALKTDTHRLLLKTDMDAGHGGSAGRYNDLRDVAFVYAFICEVLADVSPALCETRGAQ